MKEIGEKCGCWIENKEDTELKNYLRWARILVKGSRDLRDVSREKSQCDGRWVVCGDFNVTRYPSERTNGHIITGAMVEF
ncbi:hypothetical protein H5410_045942 [Solanum commersonii]|uniref:Uncharacterized protein n=1 Tax=Solanum commersonii TaxID=4109 RepID=A0A9J5XE64_SOLCO|nr:hypothetical protein H5410_045942 [Solanum commersonii]